MKKLFAILLAVISITACNNDDNNNPVNNDSVLTQTEIDDLVFMREEEKLAYDVYTYAFEKWGLNIFQNIASSELQHTTQVLQQIEAFGLQDPVGDNGLGEFTNEDFVALYNDLTATVDKSLVDALTVGALIEDLDIKDLDDVMSRTVNPTLLVLYDNLQCGSRNHLRSFTSQLTQNGATYEPSYITQSEYEAIINGDTEPCGR